MSQSNESQEGPVHYPNILRTVLRTPWAILPEKLEEIVNFLTLKAKGQDVDPARIQALTGGRRSDGVVMAGRIAVVPVFGILSQRVSLLEASSGGISTERIGITLDGLIADRQVSAIVLVFDSPGGSVFGLPQLAAQIRAQRDEKRIVGIADSLAASAAYWLLAQCSEVCLSPGSQVGSVGVIAAHVDVTEMERMMGVKTTIMTSSGSPHKAEFAPQIALSEGARAELQGKLDDYHRMFVSDLAKGRGVPLSKVQSDFGKGRMLLPDAAIAARMADRVSTLTQLVRRLGGGDSTAGPAAASASGSVTAKLANIGRGGDRGNQHCGGKPSCDGLPVKRAATMLNSVTRVKRA